MIKQIVLYLNLISLEITLVLKRPFLVKILGLQPKNYLGFKNIGESCVKLISKSDAPLSLTLDQATFECSRIEAQLYQIKTQTDVRYLMVSHFLHYYMC